MKNRIKLTLALSSAALFLGGLSSVSAASIGASFIGRDPGFSLAPTDTAGVVPQANWANLPSEDPYDGTSPTLKDSAGTFTGTKVFWEANDSWRNDGPAPTTSDQRMMKGIIKANGVNVAVTFSITNLNAGTYDVIAYGTHNNGGDGSAQPKAKFTIGTTSYYMAMENGFTNAFVQATATTTNTTPGNYVRFNGVSAVNGGITLTMTKIDTTSDGVGMAGVQVIAVTGGFPANTVAPGFANANLPLDTVTVAGQTASFTVAPNGPWDIQWYKGDTLIPGATGLTYTTPALTTADNNTTYKAVVKNNLGEATSRIAKVEVDADTPPVMIQGFLKVEHYGNIGGTAVTDLYNNDKYKNKTPDYVTYVAGAFSPDGVGDNYGRVISGYIKLPETAAEWTFYTRSDDASELYLNVDNFDPAVYPPFLIPGTDTPWAKETGCCDGYKAAGGGDETGAPFPLEAGIPYSIIGVVKEGGGGDYLYINANTTPTTPPSSGTSYIPSSWCYVMASTAGKRFTVTLQPVASAEVIEGNTVTLSAAGSSSPEPGAFAFQWQKDGVDIAGATAASYTTPELQLGQNAKYRVKFLTLLGEQFSAESDVKVIPDTFAPKLTSAGAALRGATGSNYDVGIIFDEKVNAATATAPANYILSKGTVTAVRFMDWVNVNAPGSKGASVVLEVTGLAAGDNVTVTVNNVEDPKGNKMVGASKQFRVPAAPLRWVIVGGQERVTNAATAITWRSDAAIASSADGGYDIDMLSSCNGHWDGYDEQTFAYEEITGDFSRVVRVEWQESSSQWARAGLSIREKLNIGSKRGDAADPFGRHVTVRVNPQVQFNGAAGNYSYEHARRQVLGGNYDGWGGTGGPVVYPDAWIRITRAGDVFTGAKSLDKGATWQNMGDTAAIYTGTNALPAKLFVGPFYAPELNNNGAGDAIGHSTGARFRSYGDPAVIFAPSTPPEITGAVINGNQATITWTGGGKLEQSGALGGTASWTEVQGQTVGSATVVIGTSGNMFFRVNR